MTRPVKILLWTFGGLLILLFVLGITGVYIARSDWLREKVRERIIAEAEGATGGRVEIGRFKWDWKTLTAELDDVVLHGTEPPSGPPLLRVKQLVVGLKIISLAKQDFDIAALHVEQPQAFLLVAADGTTNVPKPKTPSKTNKSGVETILDLKVADFALNRGSAEVHAAGQPPNVSSYDAAGKNLVSKFVYETAAPDYRGTVQIHPLEVRYGAGKPLPVDVHLALAILKNKLEITSAKLESGASRLEASGAMDSFTSPVVTARYNGKLSVSELGELLDLKTRQSGTVEVSGDARYVSATDYLVSGDLHARDIAFAQPGLRLRNIRADAAIKADPKLMDVRSLRIYALGGEIAGSARISNFEDFEVKGKLSRFDLRTLAALATTQKLPYDAAISGPFDARGQLSDKRNEHLLASARLALSPAGGGLPVTGVIDAKYQRAGETIALAPSFIALPHTRLDASGVLGSQLKVGVASTNLDDLLPALAITAKPGAPPQTIPVALQNGSVAFNGTVTGPLASPRIAGHATGRNFAYGGELINALDADLQAASTGASVSRAAVVYKTLRASFDGSIGLHNWTPEKYEPVQANVQIQNASVPDLLLLAGQKGFPVTGLLNTTARVTGTVGNPQATANLTLANGVAYGEPFDRITGKLDYLNGSAQLATVNLAAGPKRIDVTAQYRHAAQDFLSGHLQFSIKSNRIMLSQLRTVSQARPGVNGVVQLNAAGDVTLHAPPAGNKNAPIKFDIGKLDADLSANGLTIDGRGLGDVTVTAKTQGQTLHAHVESDVAQSSIRGDGDVQLGGDYNTAAQLTFDKVNLGTVRRLLAPPTPGQTMGVGGSIEGTAHISGPALKPDLLTAELVIPKLEMRPDPPPAAIRPLGDLTIRNTEPIRVSLANSVVRVESAHVVAHNTDITLAGQVRLKDKNPLLLRASGKLDLALAHTFDTDVTSSGALAVSVDLRGAFDNPQVTGRADLQNGNVNIAGVPNGIYNANGRILFDGSRATIESLTAQSGGGTITVAGFAAFGGPTLSFRMEAKTNGVRVRYPEGVSSVSDADVTLTGTSERSVLAGNITVNKISYNPTSDLGSLLTGSSSPAATPGAQTGPLAGLQFDVRIQTSPDIEFQTGLVEDLQTEADLRLRGTAVNPALLGRIIIDQGNLTFFSNKYVINQGTISFFNPVKIEPVIDIDLETKAQGVDVTLSVSGPVNKLNVTYRSDPPLQFSDIVGLLATGKTPSDPTIAARQPDTTQQSWQQQGANALVGQAIANPVSGRLQRFFGVSKLKIDPLLPGLGGGGAGITGGSAGARVSIEQQVTPNVVFDYVVNTNSTSSQLVRVEWDFSKQWSAVLLREENSAFGIDFLYKKRFK